MMLSAEKDISPWSRFIDELKILKRTKVRGWLVAGSTNNALRLV